LKLHPDNRPKIFLAGGTGITPFLAMIEDMRPTQSVHIYWGMDRESDFYIRPQKNGVAMHYCTDIYPVDSYLNSHPEFISGSKILKQVQHDKSPDIYLSGPPAMVNDSLAKLLAAGVDESNIFYDGK
jgi:benzoate/toluate 1,2-dioxygenase reductase subunit